MCGAGIRWFYMVLWPGVALGPARDHGGVIEGLIGMRFLFGECELDTERYELRRAGQALALEPKAFRVLAYLVQRPGQAIAKHDLFEAFWPGALDVHYKEYSLRNCLTK